jgi:hypothetical protein
MVDKLHPCLIKHYACIPCFTSIQRNGTKIVLYIVILNMINLELLYIWWIILPKSGSASKKKLTTNTSRNVFLFFFLLSSLVLHTYVPTFFSVPFLLYSYFPILFVPFLQPLTECHTTHVGRPLSYMYTWISLRFLRVPQ